MRTLVNILEATDLAPPTPFILISTEPKLSGPVVLDSASLGRIMVREGFIH